MIELRATSNQADFQRSIQTAIERHTQSSEPGPDLWQALADVGVLGLCTAASGGTPSDLALAMESLGRALCPGPVVATTATTPILHGSELEEVVTGRHKITFTDGEVIPWSSPDTSVVALIGEETWRVEVSEPHLVRTVSGEAWSRGTCSPVGVLGPSGSVAFLAQLALASYLIGAASKLLDLAAEHARARMQFGRAIGDFQAVAHPLARSKAELASACDLVRIASRSSAERPEPALAAVSLREARRAAYATAERSHQVFGAVGFAVETGVSAISTMILQHAALPIFYHPTSTAGIPSTPRLQVSGG
jgi:alkylation response protein AidB-like acyl-CoA dehydrogenase